MKKLPQSMILFMQLLGVGMAALALFLGASIVIGAKPVHALPEYTTRSGEPCAACHVNPGGGGPRTLRGLLWAANGRPDAVPELPGVLLLPGITDGSELYDFACAGCHGSNEEGLFAMGLAGTGISEPAIRSYILQGIPSLGMPSFEGKFDNEQLEALIAYLAGLASGQIDPQPDRYPLPPAFFTCDKTSETICGEP
jgi:mono/diheme cytochrome c family protein